MIVCLKKNLSRFREIKRIYQYSSWTSGGFQNQRNRVYTHRASLMLNKGKSIFDLKAGSWVYNRDIKQQKLRNKSKALTTQSQHKKGRVPLRSKRPLQLIGGKGRTHIDIITPKYSTYNDYYIIIIAQQLRYYLSG